MKERISPSSFSLRVIPLPHLTACTKVQAVVFIVSSVSGIGLHVAGHGDSHEVWHIIKRDKYTSFSYVR